MKRGWISVHRQIQDHWLWAEKPFSKGQAWIDMLLLASHEDKKFLLGNELVDVQIGSFVTSEYKLAERWGWSKTKVRAFLDLLSQDKMITKRSDHKKTTIFVVNYSNFQVRETTEEPPKNREETTEEPPKNPINNDNNYNNENKERNILFSPVFGGKVESSIPQVDIDYHHHRLCDKYGIDVTKEEVARLMAELPNIDKVYGHFGIKEN